MNFGETYAGRALARILTIALVSAVLPLVLAAPAQAVRVKTITIGDASIVEGDTGTKTLSFTITWSGSKGGAAPTVNWATAGITATAGADYTTSSGTASLSNGGCHCATIGVPIIGDRTTESTETFAVNLSSPVNATIADGQAIGTIYDNEGPPALVVADVSASEVTGTLGFSVLLTNASASTVTVAYATADGTALAGSDYTATSGTLTFTPGQISKSVDVTVFDDSLAEDDETLLVNLTSPVNATISDAQAVGTILDDDTDPIASVSDASALEGNSGTVNATFTVTLDAISGLDTSVDYSTSDGTGLAGSDYTAASGTVTITAGSTQGTFTVPVRGDLVHEGDETFTVTLSGEVNLTILDGTGIGTITDDDPVPTVSVADASVAEGNAGSAPVTLTFTLSNPSSSDASVDWSTADGTALAGSDYTASSGTVTILAGAVQGTATVPILGDVAVEANETFQVTLSNPVNASLGTGATVTITNNDKTPTTLTAKVVKRRTTVKVKGVLEPATSGLKVTVTLFRHKGTKWVRVAKKTVSLKGLKDRDGDGLLDAAYLVGFSRPSKGSYKAVAVFAGNATLAKASATVLFKL